VLRLRESEPGRLKAQGKVLDAPVAERGQGQRPVAQSGLFFQAGKEIAFMCQEHNKFLDRAGKKVSLTEPKALY
jgi:hypothetical protein